MSDEPNETGGADRPPEEQYTELVLVVHANNLPEAELFKTELEANGIPTVLEGEGAGVAGLPDVGAGVPVLVPEELADRAAELIAELESTKTEGKDLDETDEIFDESAGLEDVDDLDDDKGEDWDDDDEDDWDDDEDEDEDWDDEEWDEEEEWEDEDEV